MKTLYVCAALIAFQFASAQKETQLKGLNRITVGSDVELTLVKSSESRVVVDNDEEFEVSFENGGLTIQGDGHATVYYTTGFESLNVGSDTEITGEDEIAGKSFRLTAGSDSEVHLNLNVQDLVITAGSDSEVSLSGKAGSARATIGSDSEFRAEGLTTGDFTINLGSDGEGSIHAKGTVTAVVGSDAQLTIHGSPKKVNESKSGDAEIIVMQ